MKKQDITLLLSLLVPVWVHAGGFTEVTVGPGVDCDYATITAASSNAPGDDVMIKVAKTYNSSFTEIISNRNTRIYGGYDDCSDPTRSGQTHLDGAGFNGPMFILGTAASSTEWTSLWLRNLEISGGNSSSNGGVLQLKGSWYLVTVDVLMRNNSSSQDGGAIYLEDAGGAVLYPLLDLINGTVLRNNQADNGGAIACAVGGDMSMQNTLISSNTATDDGGGIFLTDDCYLEQYGGSALEGIWLNSAGGFGGGLHVTNGAIGRMRSHVNNTGAARISSNSAANGGGISVTANGLFEATDAIITDNSATVTGGGIRSNNGRVNIRRLLPGAQCHDELRCSSLSDNSVTGNNPSFGGGGAIATFGGTLSVTGTYFEGNSAFDGSAIRARFMPLDGVDKDLTLVGNVFAKNSGAPQVVYFEDSSGDIGFSSFIDNEDNQRMIELTYPTTSSDFHEVRVMGSIFDQAGDATASAELTTSGQAPIGDCNRNEVNATGDIAGASRSVTTTVNLVDRNSGDYRLQNSSSLNDFCNGSFLGAGSNYSANGFQRPIDIGVANNYGSYDLGGLETHDLDLIFKHGFE